MCEKKCHILIGCFSANLRLTHEPCLGITTVSQYCFGSPRRKILLPGICRQQTIFLSDLRFFVQWFHGSMVQSICDCSAVQSAVCLSKCLAAAPVFLLGATRHFVLFSCKICAEIVVYRMFAVFLNGLNGKNSSRSIVRNIFRFIFFILGFKISYSEYSFVTQIVISGIRIVS